MKKTGFILIILMLFLACKQDSNLESEISKIAVNVKVERVDLAFANASPTDLPKLKASYPFLFSERIPDSLWVQQLTDTLQQELSSEVKKTFANFDDIDSDLRGLFQHLKYYDNTFGEPRVITITSYVDYRNKTIVTDSILIIALDNYLGPDHKFYADIPRYISQNMKKSEIIVDVASDYADKYIFQSDRKSLLDEMVYFGKELYFKERMLPNKSDAEKIGYTQEQFDWAAANEEQIWSYFIERELLYSTDRDLPSRFIADAPFSKFYLDLDNESPGRLGQYMGWQIVRAYMKKNDTSLMDMLKMDALEIFKKSNFKPKK